MKLKTLIITPLILIFVLQADNISSGSTMHQYSKPGASIDMQYTSEKVDVNETSDVNITLTTPLKQGEVSVLITLDDNLSTLNAIEQNLSYVIEPQTQSLLINLQVQSQQAKLYYIRLLTKVNNGYGTKLRSFVVPVYIGKKSDFINKSAALQMKALSSGENISVSKAVETIQVLKDK